jgi:hypothetical protein
METKARRQVGVLVGLLVVLAGVLWWNVARGLAPETAAPSGVPPAATRTPQAAALPDASALEVQLGALKEAPPDPAVGTRNPFRFEPKAEPPPEHPPTPRPMAGTPTMGPDGQPVAGGVPPPPPIPLKFIGFVEEPSGHRRLAALSDGRFTYYGREGDIIEGRYRIVRIGLESIEMVHVDGRGPQTIRLSGS